MFIVLFDCYNNKNCKYSLANKRISTLDSNITLYQKTMANITTVKKNQVICRYNIYNTTKTHVLLLTIQLHPLHVAAR